MLYRELPFAIQVLVPSFVLDILLSPPLQALAPEIGMEAIA